MQQPCTLVQSLTDLGCAIFEAQSVPDPQKGGYKGVVPDQPALSWPVKKTNVFEMRPVNNVEPQRAALQMYRNVYCHAHLGYEQVP